MNVVRSMTETQMQPSIFARGHLRLVAGISVVLGGEDVKHHSLVVMAKCLLANPAGC